MGVRESVEQSGPDETRLHDIVVREEKGEELPFDPEKDISEAQWEKLLDFLTGYYNFNKNRSARGQYDFSTYLMQLRALSAKRVEDFLSRHGTLNNCIDWKSVEKNWRRKIGKLYSYDDEDLPDQIQLEREEDFDLYEEFNEEECKRRKIEQKQKMAEAIAKNAQLHHKDKKWLEFATICAVGKMYKPNRIAGVLTPEAWENMRQLLFSETGKVKFVKLAFAMKILAASEVKVTEKGLEFGEKEGASFREEKPELPVRKSF